MSKPTVRDVTQALRGHRLDETKVTGDVCSCGTWEPWMTHYDHTEHLAEVAHALFEPETVSTAEELDALPVGSVVRSEQGGVFERTGSQWSETGVRWQHDPADITLPVTVLDRPEGDR